MLTEQSVSWIEASVRDNLKRIELNGVWLLTVLTASKGLLIRRKTYHMSPPQGCTSWNLHETDQWEVEGETCDGLDATWAKIKAALCNGQ